MAATTRWRTRDYVLTTSICFLFLVLIHQARTRANLSQVQDALDATREVAIDLRLEHKRIENKLEALEAAYREVQVAQAAAAASVAAGAGEGGGAVPVPAPAPLPLLAPL
eukprot:SAG22_NODE_4775_length_1166_cov_1.690722_1_plen_109_part_01